MLIHPWDAGSRDEALAFVRDQGFGQLIAAGTGREVPVVVPTQFLLADDSTVLLHLARPNPIWRAIAENPTVLLSLAGDWAYVPAAWKAIGGEKPAEGIPTTYYAAVQLVCATEVLDDPEAKLGVLRQQLARLEPESGVANPSIHDRWLPGIRGLRLTIREINAKFKYGGNVDEAHLAAVGDRLAARGAPGDSAARAHLLRRGSYEH